MKRLQLLLMLMVALPIGMLAQGTTWQTSTEISQGGSGKGSLDKNNNEGWFKIVVPEEGTVTLNLTSDGTLNIHYLDFCRLSNNTAYERQHIYPGTKGGKLIVTNAGKGTYYVHIHRSDGAGNYTIGYQFTACPYSNDKEKNDDGGQGSMLTSGQTVQGRLGYRDANDDTDNDDWYKLEVPKDGTVRLIIDPNQDNKLNIHYVDFCRKIGDTYYERQQIYPETKKGTLTITDAGVGTYYVHIHRMDGHGGYKLSYDFIENKYANDAEPNDNGGLGSMLESGKTVEGHLGYRDANDYTDNDDWYKLEVPKNGTVRLIIDPNQDNKLNIHYVDFCRKSGDSYYERQHIYPETKKDTLTITDAGVGTYYVHIHRMDGHGGYKLRYDFIENKYANDAEPNDNGGLGSMLESGKTVEGHLGYRDGDNDTDNDDWYKLEVPKDGTVRLIIDPNQDNKLNIHYVDFCRKSGDSYYMRQHIYPGTKKDTLTITDAGVGTYYVHIHRMDGHGGYKLRYDFIPYKFIGDDEPNNTADKAILTLTDGMVVKGHLGYCDGDDDTDNDDWYKVEIPKSGNAKIIIVPEKENNLNIQYVDFCSKSGDSYYGYSHVYPGKEADTLRVGNLSQGNVFWLHVHRGDGHGGYTLKYSFEPITCIDAEPNDDYTHAIPTTDNETKAGNLGFLKGDSSVDEDDWYKLTVAEKGQLTISYDPDRYESLDATLTLFTQDMKKIRVKYNQGGIKEGEEAWAHLQSLVIETSNEINAGTYYLKVHRNYGVGTYTVAFGTPKRSTESKVRVHFTGWPSVRLGIPCEYTVKIENIDSKPTEKFFLLVHASDDIKLLGCKLPGHNGIEELPMDSISYNGDRSMVFLVPSMAPNEEYSFNIMAEGLVEGKARSVDLDPYDEANSRRKIVISGTTFLIVAGMVALDYAGDKVTEFMTDVINEHIDLDQKELDYYRENVNSKVDQQLVKYKNNTGEGVVVAKRAVKTVATSWLSTIPGGGLINFAGELIETTKTFSGAVTRRWMYWTKRDTDANYKEWEKKYDTRMLDAKLGCNNIVRSWDPNEMVGPVGVGDKHYIPETKTMNYRILFENKKEATAPAYRIRISDELDPNVFDVSSVRFGGTSHDNAGFGWKMSRDGNKLSWDIEGIELPPNVKAPEGEGYVTFSVDLKPGLKSGTQIKNKATIIFDYNEAIVTNEYVNTLDLAAPTAKMKDIGKQSDGKFVVTCEGSDNESGVSHYQFYASKNGADYEFLGESTTTSLSFVAEANVNYNVIAYAVDNVGNRQQTAPDPIAFNPSGINTLTTIPYDSWTITRLNGTTVSSGKGVPSMDLPAGVYIIRQGQNVRKVIVK
ncbi:MAG: hypothetical protein K5764_03140 [Prevotella sp.]|nr:hypothetical protein [Prevotella sp.]